MAAARGAPACVAVRHRTKTRIGCSRSEVAQEKPFRSWRSTADARTRTRSAPRARAHPTASQASASKHATGARAEKAGSWPSGRRSEAKRQATQLAVAKQLQRDVVVQQEKDVHDSPNGGLQRSAADRAHRDQCEAAGLRAARQESQAFVIESLDQQLEQKNVLVRANARTGLLEQFRRNASLEEQRLAGTTARHPPRQHPVDEGDRHSDGRAQHRWAEQMRSFAIGSV